MKATEPKENYDYGENCDSRIDGENYTNEFYDDGSYSVESYGNEVF